MGKKKNDTGIGSTQIIIPLHINNDDNDNNNKTNANNGNVTDDTPMGQVCALQVRRERMLKPAAN